MKRKQVQFQHPATDQRYEQQCDRLQRLEGSVHDEAMTEADAPIMRRRPSSYVPAAPETKAIVRRLPTELGTTSHTIDVAPSAQHIVSMKTSAVDRAQGFLIANVPLFAAFALAFVIVSVFFFDVPFLSLPALVIFWITFVLAWLASYIYTLAVSAEGIALYEAKKKWQVIEREQSERWDYYKKMNGGE